MWFRTCFACAVTALAIMIGNAHLSRAQTIAKPSASFELQVDEVYNKRGGGEVEYSVVFRDPLTREFNPTLQVIEGERVTIKLVNRTHGPRSFAIMGVKGAATPPVAAGASTTLQFRAPARGAYVYHDPGRPSFADARTLFGDLIVSPKPGG